MGQEKGIWRMKIGSQEEMEALETALRQAERVVLSAFGQESM